MKWYTIVQKSLAARVLFTARRFESTLGTDMAFGAKLKQLRMKKGKSLQETADAVEISKTHLFDLEHGNSKNPSIELLVRLSRYLDVTVAELVGENPYSPDADPQIVAMYRDLQSLSKNDRETIKLLMERLRKPQTE